MPVFGSDVGILMSCQKRKVDKEECVRGVSHSVKRACFREDSLSPSKSKEDQKKDHRPSYTGEEHNRVVSILEAEFEKELQAKEEEIIEIQERIQRTQRILQYLCYVVVSDFYSREKTITSVASTRQRRIHPAVKKLLSGKGPPGAPEEPRNVTIPADGSPCSSSNNCSSTKFTEAKDNDILARVDSPNSFESLSEKERKVPRYIPPKPKSKTNVGSQSEPVRGGQNKVKTILVIGNVSKWLPPDTRDDAASHKWMVYVRGPKDAPDISSFVSKVRFFLHPSYRPNDVVQVVCAPFQLSRRGWGEFPIRVQIHFRNNLNKPVDIIHNLKLDRTYSGLQTLGAETVAEVWLHREKLPTDVHLKGSSFDDQLEIKEEIADSCDESTSKLVEVAHPTTASSNLIYSSSTISPNASSETSKQKVTNEISSQSISAPEMSIPPEDHEVFSNCLSANSSISSTVLKGEKLEPASSVAMTPRVKGEPYCESDNSLVNKLTNPVSLQYDAELPKLISSAAMLSTTKVSETPKMMTSSSTSRPLIQKVQETFPKLESSNSPGINAADGIQRVQVSPTKPGIQLVKCIDSKGNARLLQVRSDLLPKILKGSSTVVPPTPASTQGSPVKIAGTNLPTAEVLPHIGVNKETVKIALKPPAVAPSAGAGSIPSPRLPAPVGKQVLRLVRPAGNVNPRPILVASNPATQPCVSLPVQASGNGHRPLLVLKDGKLFMMKSAISPATSTSGQIVRTLGSSLNPVVGNQTNHTIAGLESLHVSSGSITKTTVAKSNDTCVTSDSASGGSLPATVTSEMLNVDSDQKKNDCDARLNNLSLQPPNMLLKARSSVTNPPVVRLSSFKSILASDQVKQSTTKFNALTQDLAAPTPSQIMSNALAVAPKIAVKPGKSLLKSAVSVLKSNVGATSLASKTCSPSLGSVLPSPLHKLSSLPSSHLATLAPTTSKRIILGRTSGPSSITATSQKVLMYQRLLGSVLKSCPKCPVKEVWRAVRWMIKHLSLINSEAKNPEFKILHPYCAPDEETFCSWNIGKQRACEWLRAKTARSLLKEAGWDLKNVWTTREIVLWARFHGYTPGLPMEECTKPRKAICGGDCLNPLATLCEYGEMNAVQEWIVSLTESTDVSSQSRFLESGCSSTDSDEEVDIESPVISTSNAKVKKEPVSVENTRDEMPLESSLHPLSSMVTSSLKQFGLSLSSEEIAPGVHYPAALRVLIQAVQSLTEDLGRRALADAWGKNTARRPGTIETSNICGAICHRPELDILSCAGLGTRSHNLFTSLEKKEKKS